MAPPAFICDDAFVRKAVCEYAYVLSIVANLTTSGKTEEKISKRKRKRGNDDCPEISFIEKYLKKWTTMLEKESLSTRRQFVKFINSEVRTLLNDFRNLGKEKMFRMFLFFVQLIKNGVWDVATAKKKGFFASWDARLDTDILASGEYSLNDGSTWRIPLLSRKNPGLEHNRQQYENMRKRFQSMNCTLHYPCFVKTPCEISPLIDDYRRDASSVSGAALKRPRQLAVNFHTIAVNFLQQIITLEEGEDGLDAVLSTSVSSLRAIHIIALGLRGLLRSALGEETTEYEKAAYYCVTTDEQLESTDYNKSPIVMGAREYVSIPGSAYKPASNKSRDDLIAGKISMTYDMWKEEKLRAEEEQGHVLTPQQFQDLPYSKSYEKERHSRSTDSLGDDWKYINLDEKKGDECTEAMPMYPKAAWGEEEEEEEEES